MRLWRQNERPAKHFSKDTVSFCKITGTSVVLFWVKRTYNLFYLFFLLVFIDFRFFSKIACEQTGITSFTNVWLQEKCPFARQLKLMLSRPVERGEPNILPRGRSLLGSGNSVIYISVSGKSLSRCISFLVFKFLGN